MKFVRLFSLAALAAAVPLFTGEIEGSDHHAALHSEQPARQQLRGRRQELLVRASARDGDGQPPQHRRRPPVAGRDNPGRGRTSVRLPAGGAGIVAGPNQVGDLLLNYRVISALPILSVTLFATGGATGNGSALITEIVTNTATGVVIGNATIVSGTVTIVLTQALTDITISKDIAINGGTQVGASGASYSDIRQTFNQIIPEPTSVVMLGLGLAGVAGLALPGEGERLNRHASTSLDGNRVTSVVVNRNDSLLRLLHPRQA